MLTQFRGPVEMCWPGLDFLVRKMMANYDLIVAQSGMTVQLSRSMGQNQAQIMVRFLYILLTCLTEELKKVCGFTPTELGHGTVQLAKQIAEIDDKLLDAWEDVEPSQFKYNDAVSEKGKDKARLHTGYVVQQIDSACKSHGVDISAYGLYCHEEYPQETEEIEVEQADGTKTKEKKVIREASEHYSLRYTEVYAVECMYLRRCIARLTARIEELEKGNNTK